MPTAVATENTAAGLTSIAIGAAWGLTRVLDGRGGPAMLTDAQMDQVTAGIGRGPAGPDGCGDGYCCFAHRGCAHLLPGLRNRRPA